jgi:hypothetical protein
MIRLHHVPTVLAALAVAVAACGGTTMQQLHVSGPFTEEHQAAFENGIDYIEDPTILEGSWLTSWEDEINRRVTLSDAIALVTVTTLRQDLDLDRRSTYRLIVHVDRRRHGDVPDEVVLVVRQADAGFGTVDGNDGRILNQRFVAFLKWVDDNGRIAARWHLSPAGDRVVRRVNSLVERLRTPAAERRRVIVREHTSGDAEEEEEEEDDL